MRIAILGLGNMGKGLAKRLAGKADLYLGTRDADAARGFAAGLAGNVVVTDADAAAEAAEVVILALPFVAALEEARRNTHLAGKVVVDITNPITADFSGLSIGFDTSAAEQIQQAVPQAKVVKAYNTIFAQLFDAPRAATAAVPVFVSGDDAAALDAVTEIVTLSGFAVEPSGNLAGARLIEPLGMLNIRLGYHQGRGVGIAPAWTQIAA